MRILGLCLAAALVLATAARATEPAKDKDAKNNIDHVQEAFDRLGKMGAPQQRVWLERLEKRAARAATLTFEPKQAARQIAKIRTQLHQKTVTWKALGDVADDTNAWEKAVIKRLVKHYRTLVFEAFHKQIDEYGRRQQAWIDVRADWTRAGSQFDQQDRLIDWLGAAAVSVAPDKIGPIPEKPKFEPWPKAEDTKPQPEPKRSTDGAGPIEPGPPPVIAKSRRGAVRGPRFGIAEPPLPRPEPAEVALAEPHRSAVRLLVWRHEVEQRGAAESHGAPPATFARLREPQPPREVKTLTVSRPTAGERIARKVPVFERSKERFTTARLLPPAAEVSPLVAPLRGISPAELAAIASDNLPVEKVEIQTDELAARIGGCNLAFRALETDLIEKGEWDAARLEPFADRLKWLVTRRNDLQLFREVISDVQRASVDPLASPKGVVSPLAARIVEARRRASGSDFHGTESERQAELQRLDELSRLLAELAGQ